MLDISRGRVPKLETLLELAEQPRRFQNQRTATLHRTHVRLSKYKSVWQSWGALTGEEIRQLDAHCQQLGIDLVPNQNSFGHLRYFLEHPRLKKLAEVSEPYADEGGGICPPPDHARAESSGHPALPARPLRRIAAEFFQPVLQRRLRRNLGSGPRPEQKTLRAPKAKAASIWIS